MGTRTLAVCCEGFPALVAGRGVAGGGAEGPLAVMRANKVCSVNVSARGEGVRPGMRRRDAQARCPELEVVAPDEQRDARSFEQVLAVLASVAPRWEVTEPGRCSVPVRGPSRVFGGDRVVAARVHSEVTSALRELVGAQPSPSGPFPSSGVSHPRAPVGVAVADGPWAAAILAEAAAREALGSRPGISVMGAGETAAQLSRMPTRTLLLGGPCWAPRDELTRLVDVLERLGVVTLGRFALLERTDVLARFGRCGMLAHDLARGTESHRIALEELRADFSVSAGFDPPAETVDQVGFMARTLAGELHSELGDRGQVCTRLSMVIETELGERIERLWRDGGAIDAAGVAQRARWQLEGWLSSGHTVGRRNGAVARLELLADQVVPDDGRQLGLWGEGSVTPERAERGIARLVALLGPDAVVVPRLSGGRSPGERYRMVPVGSTGQGSTGQGSKGQGSTGQGCGAPWPGKLPGPPPMLVWPDPPRAEIHDSSGRVVGVSGRGLLSAEPVSLVIGRGPGSEIRSWAGPWCIDERWWDPLGHRRRARLQVLVHSGAHLLTLEAGDWRIEATYD